MLTRRSGSVAKKADSIFRYSGGPTDRAGGAEIAPMTVVIGSLVFIVVIIVLHFYGKFMR